MGKVCGIVVVCGAIVTGVVPIFEVRKTKKTKKNEEK